MIKYAEKKQPAINKTEAEQLITKYEQGKGTRTNFESYWQSLHDYFYLESPDHNKSYYPGTELDFNYLYDSTTLESADVLASGFMNYLTPPTSKWFRLRTKDPGLTQNKEVANWLEDVTDEIYYVINRSNFYEQMFPSYKSSGVYGTSMMFEEDDVDEDARFYNMPLSQCLPIEDEKGRVVEFFIEFEYTASQAAMKWGAEKLSTEMRDEINDGSGSKKHKFLLYMAKRHVREIQKSDKLNMPIKSLWLDVKGKQTMEEGGFNEFPAFAHRFDKRPFIPWGFSPGMKALPIARILNAIAKTNLRNLMKNTDPPVAVPDNAFIMPFNQNPRAINYYKREKMTGGSKDIFSFGNYGDPQTGLAATEIYQQQVKSLMYNDVFLAFNNITKEMNNPEIMERINEKMTLLGPAVGRYLSEMLNPVVHRTLGILMRKGKLPDPPDEMRNNPYYEIDFVGVLAQAQRRSELNTLITGLTMVGNLSQFTPEVLDKIDSDRVVDEVWNITGASVQVLRDDAEISKLRDMRAEKAAQQEQAELIAAGVETAKVASEADKNFALAQESNK